MISMLYRSFVVRLRQEQNLLNLKIRQKYKRNSASTLDAGAFFYPALPAVAIFFSFLLFSACLAKAAGPKLIGSERNSSATKSKSLCSWDLREIGNIDKQKLPELSGMALSSNYPGRFYFHNDSGSGPRFYSWDQQKNIYQQIEVKGMLAIDIEAMAYSDCPTHASPTTTEGAEKCIILADIGDNLTLRGSIAPPITLTWIKEESNFSSIVEPAKILKLSYPNGAKNAESFAVSQNGDLYILTKPGDREKNIEKPTVYLYRIRKAQWQSLPELSPQGGSSVSLSRGGGSPEVAPEQILLMEEVSNINLFQITGKNSRKQNTPTDMVFDEARNRWFILTYKNIIMISNIFTEDGEFSFGEEQINNALVIPLDNIKQQDSLKQQESLGIDLLTGDLFYSSEAAKENKHVPPLMHIRLNCK